MKTKLLKFLFLSVLMSSFALAWGEGSTQDQVYDKLKAKYLKLRNTDVTVSQEEEWKSLVNNFVLFAERHKTHEKAAPALFNAATLQAYRFKKTRDQAALLESLDLFEKLVQRYPDHFLADDALLKRGDLFMRGAGDKKSALRCYEEIISAYPDADMYELARVRVSKMNGLEVGDKKPEKVKRKPEPAPTKKPVIAKKTGPVIVIDPGHGGEDFGAVGIAGLLEKDVVLAIAFELKKILEKELDASVRLTRRTDGFVPLAERTNMANDFEADMFISLHSNSTIKGNGEGLEIYYLDNTDSAGSLKLAERENASVRLEGPAADLQFMLSDLIQSAKRDESIALANHVQKETVKHLKKKWKSINDRGVKRAPFYVLVGAHMPCILAEIFFINNPSEGVLLGRDDFRSDIARGMAKGIKKFFEDEASREEA